ncbi:glycosyltransferase [Candidatus Roizmanbacteria bacterium]|nr:glycosyltransferase [Candidatus Roizmanbacteria bacterium]
MRSDLLTIVVPTLNEAENILPLVERIDSSLKTKFRYEIIFVDDHSIDNTISVIQSLTAYYPVRLHVKKGKRGKAYSILEGAAASQTEYIAMLDGDLQYPPEVLPELFTIAREKGIAVANRSHHKTSLLRRVGSKINSIVFERLLHGFTVDTQSGLKVFKKEIIEHITPSDVSGWALDMPLLHTALQLGYNIGSIDIEFAKRRMGKSKIQFLQASYEIALNAIKLKLKKPAVYPILPDTLRAPIGAGIVHKGKRFITHTRLSHDKTAFQTFLPWQKWALINTVLLVVTGFLLNTAVTAIVIIGILTFIYLVDFLFSLYLMIKSLHFSPEISVSDEELLALNNNELPIYTILCPLYKEASVLPQFVEAMDQIDWPKNKLEVILLFEEDDTETIEAARNLHLPRHFRILVVPDSQPKTKPKACNFGFAHATGEYIVIFDAEDRPDPQQLKKAYIGFKKSADTVVCLQSKLNYYNAHQNWLTRLFTAEYSLWFDLILPGLQSVETTIPLGGTSNHFKAAELSKLKAWDPFNVTEDCDIGARIFRDGKRTAIINSTTYEEANSYFFGWLRQRSRWIKGYVQTYLVHMRDPLELIKTHGVHALIFQLVIGMRMVFLLINPVLWLFTISYFTLYPIVGPTIEALYPPVVFYPAVTLLVFGNFMHVYNNMIGSAKRGHWGVIKYVLLTPLYWVMTSVAAGIAFYQLFVKPHYWEKTRHGFHLEQKLQYVPKKSFMPTFQLSPHITGGSVVIAASMLSNAANFMYNAYLGRAVSLAEFGTVSLISTLYMVIGVLTGALGRTVSYVSARWFGKEKQPAKHFWAALFSRTVLISLVVTIAWIIGTPFLSRFFNTETTLPFILFTPALIFLSLYSLNSGYLSGNLKFFQAGFLIAGEAIFRLLLAVVIVSAGYHGFVYASIPGSIASAFLLSWFFVYRFNKGFESKVQHTAFPKKFFGVSLLAGLSTIAFLSFDIMLAKHFLAPDDAGKYALISLTGKIIYFLGALFTQFITPLVSYKEGANVDTKRTFHLVLAASAIASFAGYLLVGMGGAVTVPILFGEKARAIISYLPFYGLAMVEYVVASCIINYHHTKRHYLFPVVGFLFAGLQVVGLYTVAKTLHDFIAIVSVLAIVQFGVVSLLHLLYPVLSSIGRNMHDMAGIFTMQKTQKPYGEKLRILVLNWRDKKHGWAGGAEVYVHELAKRWVEDGHRVTLFCGNDGNNPRNEVIDGVQMVRRGGFYTVYIWAAFYYLFGFRGNFDLIIDCENGIPFFTPLYSSLPKYLLIHHVHQDVFRRQLPFPLSNIAIFFESTVMPRCYRRVPIITISESSRRDIVSLGWAKEENIEIVNPGIDVSNYKREEKTPHPCFVYLGRLKQYKNVHVAIGAFSRILERNPKARLVVAGDGESRDYLKNVAAKLNLNGTVQFTGRISEEKKVQLLSSAWVVLQPSSFEGWGITVLEANASGTPVIASNTKGLSDSVVNGRTGLLVPVGNEEEMARSMEYLIQQENYRRELSREAIEWSKKFSWEHASRKFMDIICKSL